MKHYACKDDNVQNIEIPCLSLGSEFCYSKQVKNIFTFRVCHDTVRAIVVCNLGNCAAVIIARLTVVVGLLFLLFGFCYLV